MAARQAIVKKQRIYWGRVVVAASLAVIIADFALLLRPLWDMTERLKEGLLGILPAAGMCLLNATHALAFHQADYLWLASHILVLSCAVIGLIAGGLLLRPKAPRMFVFELTLAPEFQGRETINNGSR